jgi:hypothetical protein
MTIGSISAAGLSQYVLSSSNGTPLQQAFRTLQNSLASGDLNGAKSAFQTVQKVNQVSATADGSSLSSSSQLSTDLAALGGALRSGDLSSGDLSTAQSAFAAVQSDLKNTPSPSQANETNAASRSVQLVEELLSAVNSSSSSSSTSDLTNSVLERVYGSRGSLNVLA